MSEVKRYDPNYDVISPADDSMVLTHDGLFVESSEYDQLKAENERLGKTYLEVYLERDTLRKQLDEADEVLGRKNARIAEFAERHLKDFVELERLDKQLDEARELLRLYGYSTGDLDGRVDAWMEACK